MNTVAYLYHSVVRIPFIWDINPVIGGTIWSNDISWPGRVDDAASSYIFLISYPIPPL